MKWNQYRNKEMEDYSAIESYLVGNNLHYFTFSPISEKPMKAVIHHLPPDMSAEDISSSFEDFGFKVMNVRQMTATQRAPNGQTQAVPLPLFLVTITRNIKSQEIFEAE
jgi:hypothetical protein